MGTDGLQAVGGFTYLIFDALIKTLQFFQPFFSLSQP
jgi:hypothetical protein